MKNIKSLIIGFLLATCMFLFMGATSSNSGPGKYQVSTCTNNFQGFPRLIETIIDTQTGKVLSRDLYNHKSLIFKPWHLK